MTESENIYRQATGVNIEEQKQIWDERGKGYYGEYLVFNELYGNIPGQCKILMNCEIPTSNGKTTEIDLILIHETGIYSFEIKHYKGDIYVNLDQEHWTQYFRTVQNETFHNPIRQNAYHISALKKMFPDYQVYSFVVFTNGDCRLRIDGSVQETYPFANGVLCKLSSLKDAFTAFAFQHENVLPGDQIDEIFRQLVPYSKLQNVAVQTSAEPVPILEYFSRFNQAFKDKVKVAEDSYKALSEQLETETEEKKAEYRRKSRIAYVIAAAAMIIAVLGTTLIPIYRIKAAESNAAEEIASAERSAEERIAALEEKYQQFFKKFDDANEIVSGKILTSDLVRIDNLIIRPADGLDDSLVVSFDLVGIEGDFALGLTADTKLIVRFTDGEVKECDIYYENINNLYKNNAWLYRLGRNGFASITVDNILITDLRSREIANIKLNSIAVYRQPNGTQPFLTNVEITVFSASD